ncbi:glycosyltransferase family 4 protein [Roseiconus nitratireducens]|uniref:Glycosyltransferase family 4 protein n=1 Tax=Roseiconus nitratireducens TaxID=2605748 RepID=A0A5M6D9A3_9BACT|nr:glycosyltransferase family 4 protein [Roseiconus nitratireducens]KAA5543206.1 glycosyltransferase family 4 protein [Roseiconus nitratireducens]
MRIAQIAPLAESVPPKTYGGIERVVHYLTEDLVSLGHDVILFASGDSRTKADLVSIVKASLRTSSGGQDPVIRQLCQIAEVVRLSPKFDVLHFHTDFLHFPVCRFLNTPMVTTLHGRLDLPDYPMLFEEYNELPVVSISFAQRAPVPGANWIDNVYNGTPLENYVFRDTPDNYFAFLGRLSPEKGPTDAIRIAQRLGVPLKIAAKIDAVDRDYFEKEVRPLLDDPLIEYIGEVDENGKNELLGGARALLFPIAWPEPFGLVMTEAMACGTPVVARRNGSVEEVMRNGVSGFVVDDLDQAVAAAAKVDQIDRRGCRRYFEDHFSVRRMTEGYLQVYTQLIGERQTAPSRSPFDLRPIHPHARPI